jgi:hypothetical protein
VNNKKLRAPIRQKQRVKNLNLTLKCLLNSSIKYNKAILSTLMDVFLSLTSPQAGSDVHPAYIFSIDRPAGGYSPRVNEVGA